MGDDKYVGTTLVLQFEGVAEFGKLILKPENNIGRVRKDGCIRDWIRLVRDGIYCQDVSVSIEMQHSLNYLSDCKLSKCEFIVLISISAQ
jgi:hypothetical protein